MVEPFLEGMTLQDAIATKKVYIVNLDYLAEIMCRFNRLVSFSNVSLNITLHYVKKQSIWKKKKKFMDDMETDSGALINLLTKHFDLDFAFLGPNIIISLSFGLQQ